VSPRRLGMRIKRARSIRGSTQAKLASGYGSPACISRTGEPRQREAPSLAIACAPRTDLKGPRVR